MASSMIPITGLWKSKTKDGKAYLSGPFGGARILIFPNDYKEAAHHPDYQMYVAQSLKKDEQKGEKKDEEMPPVEDEDLPF